MKPVPKGTDPYNTAPAHDTSREHKEPRPGSTPEQVREAEQILACYETELEVLS